mgnify:CR=1 FL=1
MNITIKKTCLKILIAGASLNLLGCANAILTATDPRSFTTVMSDTEITQSLGIDYMEAENFGNLSVTVYNHKALLTGQVNTYQDRSNAVQIAHSNNSVKKVYDYLVVENPDKYQSSTINDSYITAKVKTDLFSTSGVSSNDVKLVTNGGIVYIFGIVPANQEQKIYNEAMAISGVKKVVILIEK